MTLKYLKKLFIAISSNQKNNLTLTGVCMNHPIKEILSKRKLGIHVGIPSFCTANGIVIEAILEYSKKFNDYVLIEATANQVN